MALLFKVGTHLSFIFVLCSLVARVYSSELCNSKINLTVDNFEIKSYQLNIDDAWIKSGKSSCSYLFETSEDYGFKIEFEKFSIQEPRCFEKNIKNGCCDFFEIGTGVDIGTNSYAVYCGSSSIETVVLESNKIWLNYLIENSANFESVNIKIEPFRLVFKDVVQGIFSSEENYFNNMNLTYKILANEHSLINFNFLDTFSIESSIHECIDFLEIGSLDEITLEPIGNSRIFCGDSLPAQFILNTSKAYVRIFTDENGLNSGFTLAFNAIQNVFTEPEGNILSSSNPTSINYKIIAPIEKRIELIIEEFKFLPCLAKETNDLINYKNNKICLKNHHIIISNKQGSIESDFFNSIRKLNNLTSNGDFEKEWLFCDCNKPFKKYISLGNELTLSHVLNSVNDLGNQVKYNISYRFVNSEFDKNNQIRIIQDSTRISPINGYMFKVKVPANNHLRIYGKSISCSFPVYTLLSKKTIGSDKRTENTIKLDFEQFNSANCSYFFDISEPKLKNKKVNNGWYVDWYLKFNNPFELFDFELNWIFLKNKIKDEKKSAIIDFPMQYGFNISEELEFSFELTREEAKYSLRLEKTNMAKSLDENKAYLKKASPFNNREEFLLVKINSTELKLDVGETLIKLKRNDEWSMRINYEMQSSPVDCDFDTSLCNYTNRLFEENHYGVAHPIDLEAEHKIEHLQKYVLIDTQQSTFKNNLNDFYLSISRKSSESKLNSTIFSPLIQVQKAKLMKISFSYMTNDDSNDTIGLNIVLNRSDIRKELKQYLELSDITKTIAQFSNSKSLQNSFIHPLMSKLNECTNDSPTISNHRNRVWKRVEKIPLFSCFDFHLAFVINFKENSETASSFELNKIGLDDIEINSENELEKCNDKKDCNNNGKCYLFNNEKVCCCNPGYKGAKCENSIKPCDLFLQNNVTICKNGGECVNNKESFDYSCKCSKGYTGEDCAQEINECDPNPCGNNGVCIDKIGGYKCICQLGFSGKNCLKVESLCEKCSDKNTLKCIADKANTICKCKPGFTGEECKEIIEINECLSNPCLGNAICVDEKQGFKCICPEDATGKHCELKIDYCQNYGKFCENNSTCISSNKDGSKLKCACAIGFTGKYCNETAKSRYCDSNPCNSGKCIENEMGYDCDCPKGLIGRHCNLKPSTPCFKNKCVHGLCVELPSNDYKCSCYAQYTGEFCDFELCNKEKHADDCVKNNTIDIVRDKSFEDQEICVCLCKNGFTGKRCENKENVCDIVPDIEGYGNECHNGGTCYYDINANQMKCKCSTGYFGDRCQISVNHCKSNPCKYGKCLSLVEENTYKCECSKGWTGVNCDSENKQCSIEKDCHSNNTLSVLYSQYIDECVCMCKFGFEGKKCEIDFNDCQDNKCKNDAECIDLLGTYECKCKSGFTGEFCEKKLEKCALNPCKNGTCEDLAMGFTCNCDRGFTGKFCEIEINKCEPSPCQNEGICHNLIDDYQCECLPDFGSSRNCTLRKVDPCLVSPCLNNATCSSMRGRSEKEPIYTGFSCRCSSSYTGKYCETPIDFCSTNNPCKNHGRCTIPKENPSDYKCVCFPAFKGKNCEYMNDPCSNMPCDNGGTCFSTPEGFKCKCPFNYAGENCEKYVRPCENMNCLNGGKCMIGSHEVPYCECSNKRFIGTQCEIDLELYTNITVMPELKSSSEVSEFLTNCDVLGNDPTSIDYVFAAIIIFFILILLISIIYSYVHINIKRVERYSKQVNFENQVIEEINHMTYL